MRTESPVVTEEQVGAYQRDGVVVLRGILGHDEVATLERGVERNLADLSPLGMNATRPGEPGAFVEDFRNWQRIPEYAEVIRGSRLAAAAAARRRRRPLRAAPASHQPAVRRAGRRARAGRSARPPAVPGALAQLIQSRA
jgi:hypothetical protein